MADNLLNADLGPVHWTGGVSTREPRQEERGRHGRGAKQAIPAIPVEESTGEVGETPSLSTSDSAPHKLDSFA